MHYYSHIFHVLTPILAILALTRSLHHALLVFNIFSSVFTVFILFLILSCMLCLCDRVNDVPFEGEQEQAYEEENQQLNEEGKWISPPLHVPF